MSQVEDELVELGYQILAVSPSRPDKLDFMTERNGYAYRALSDSKLTLAESFGLVWHMSDSQIERYEANGMDLEDDAGEAHHNVPVPAAYVIGTDGVIDFAYVNPNHRQRIPGAVLLAAARAALEE